MSFRAGVSSAFCDSAEVHGHDDEICGCAAARAHGIYRLARHHSSVIHLSHLTKASAPCAPSLSSTSRAGGARYIPAERPACAADADACHLVFSTATMFLVLMSDTFQETSATILSSEFQQVELSRFPRRLGNIRGYSFAGRQAWRDGQVRQKCYAGLAAPPSGGTNSALHHGELFNQMVTPHPHLEYVSSGTCPRLAQSRFLNRHPPFGYEDERSLWRPRYQASGDANWSPGLNRTIQANVTGWGS